MENILSTLKGEYSRTLLLIIIPGAIALEPFAIILYKYQSLQIPTIKESFVILGIIYFLASIFMGFIVQDIGSRIENNLDRIFCRRKKIDILEFQKDFDRYLFNEKQEDYIITHYYRTILVRMKFEIHTCASIIVLWIGSICRTFMEKGFKLNFINSLWFILVSISVFIYLRKEALSSVKLLYEYRIKINKKFNPTI